MLPYSNVEKLYYIKFMKENKLSIAATHRHFLLKDRKCPDEKTLRRWQLKYIVGSTKKQKKASTSLPQETTQDFQRSTPLPQTPELASPQPGFVLFQQINYHVCLQNLIGHFDPNTPVTGIFSPLQSALLAALMKVIQNQNQNQSNANSNS